MAVWIYAGTQERLPEPVKDLIDAGGVHVSPLVELEMAYLHEIGRARDPATKMLAALRRDVGLQVADASVAELIHVAAGLTWTRDPFDRMIAAHALVADVPLATADRTILEHLPLATWG